MDLEQKLQAFQQKYSDLEQQAAEGSVQKHVYNQIGSFCSSPRKGKISTC